MTLGIPFGNYQLTRRLARGGMAEVFLATQKGPESFERTVAVKRILPHLADIEQFVEMFMDEARLAAKLSHPNVAHIYEFGRVDDSYFIAMEYIEGVDLSVIILEGPARPLPLEHAARIIADVCAALHYAHSLNDKDGVSLGIVHRDISPQNILVSFGGAVKVVDFGIAKAAAHIERTRPGVVRGKFTYMSPEQVEGKPLDGRADLFCAGIVLYELCTCEALFPRTNPIEAMRRVRAADIPPPRRDGQPLPLQLERILRRALARRREERYRNAAEMQMDLEAYLRTASQISNSIILGEYFTSHYRKLRQPAGEAPEGTAAARPGTAKAVAQARTPVSEEDKTLVVDDVRKDDLEQSTVRSPASAHAAGTIDRSDAGLGAPPEQTSESGPYEPIQSDQLVADAPHSLAGYATIIPVPADEQRTVLSPGRSGPLAPEPTDPDTVPPAEPTPIDTQMPTVPPTPLHAAKTALFGTTIRVRSVGRRMLVIGLVIAVALAGVVVGYWLSNPGEPPGTEARPALIPPDRALTVVAPPRRTDARAPHDRGRQLATLHIQTKPEGASITIDGLEVPGTTPLQHSVHAGHHTVVASYPEFEDRASAVDVAPGEIVSLSLKLRRLAQEQVVTLKTKTKGKVKAKAKPKIKAKAKAKQKKDAAEPPPVVATGTGFLSITTIPWSTVFLEEKKIGITPFANVKVPAGTHKLRFMDAKGQTTFRTVTIKPGEVSKLRFNLPKEVDSR